MVRLDFVVRMAEHEQQQMDTILSGSSLGEKGPRNKPNHIQFVFNQAKCGLLQKTLFEKQHTQWGKHKSCTWLKDFDASILFNNLTVGVWIWIESNCESPGDQSPPLHSKLSPHGEQQ